VKEYRYVKTVRAERVNESGNVITNTGPVFAAEGSYLVYAETGGFKVVDGDVFEKGYSEVKRDSEFVPQGKTVDQVVDYLKENPDDIERVKQLERDGASRKGILEYEV
jgi:hypothetical protein